MNPPTPTDPVTPTPRTDNVRIGPNHEHKYWEDFARQLERDLTAATAKIAELNRDKTRLDWLENAATYFKFGFMLNGADRENFASGPVVRQAINAALSAPASAKQEGA